jgi:hypothetical protein
LLNLRVFIVALTVCLGSSASAAVQTAPVEATGYSLVMDMGITGNGEAFFFTTHDNSTDYPLTDCDAVTCWVSQEFFPPTLGSTTYIADYLIQDSIGVYEWGEVWLSGAVSDSDGDGAFDQLERLRNGNFTFAGTTYPHWNAFSLYYNSSVSGSVQRSSGDYAGSYSGVFSNPAQTQPFGGRFGISGAHGRVDYEPGADTIDWYFQRLSIDGSPEFYTGTSLINRLSNNEILIPSFWLNDSTTGGSILTYPVTLYRDGWVFRGHLTIDDGELTTWWRDYVDFEVEITDGNDFNSDGLPDLVFVPEPGSGLMLVSGVIGVMGLGHLRIRRSPRRDRSA